ncbi:MAG: HEAT repeat domain-containing protein, partial [Luteolibacter sp.]
NAEKNDPRKKRMPASWYAKLMHHYSPTVRDWAAHGLGFLGEEAIPEIRKALASKDGRLRVAALDAISCSGGWGIGRTSSNITPAMIRQHFLPQILAPLKDPTAATWEKRHALMALSCADPSSIKPNLEIIKPYFHADEWWLRAAAFAVMHPLISDSSSVRAMLPTMLDSYDNDTNLPSRRWGATRFFKEAIAVNPELKQEILDGMAKSLKHMPIRDGLHQAIDVNNIFESLRYVDMKKHPENAVPILPSIERVYPRLEPLPASWTVVGARWGNIGLANAAAILSNDGRPFVASLKRIRPDLEMMANSKHRQAKETQKALARLDEIVTSWESQFGEVETE